MTASGPLDLYNTYMFELTELLYVPSECYFGVKQLLYIFRWQGAGQLRDGHARLWLPQQRKLFSVPDIPDKHSAEKKQSQWCQGLTYPTESPPGTPQCQVSTEE